MQLEGSGAALAGGFTSLQSLKLVSCMLDKRNGRSLLRLPLLEDLDVCGCAGLPVGALAQLTAVPGLHVKSRYV